MEVIKFKHCILEKNLPTISILIGDECLRHIYLEELYKRFSVKRMYDIEDYVGRIKSKFNMDSEDTIYIIYNEEKLRSNSKWWNTEFKNLILVYDKLDKKDKFYKAFEPQIVNFEPLSDELLEGLLRNRLNLPDEYLQEIIKKCNSNYFKCINEANKISIFDKTQHLDMFNNLLRENTFCVSDGIDSFEFVNAFTSRDKKKCLELVKKISKEDIIGQLSLVYNSIKNELLVRGSNNQTAEQLGINPKLYYVLSKKRYFTIEELCKILIDIGNKLMDIKSGAIDSVDALYLIILECL